MRTDITLIKDDIADSNNLAIRMFGESSCMMIVCLMPIT